MSSLRHKFFSTISGITDYQPVHTSFTVYKDATHGLHWVTIIKKRSQFGKWYDIIKADSNFTIPNEE